MSSAPRLWSKFTAKVVSKPCSWHPFHPIQIQPNTASWTWGTGWGARRPILSCDHTQSWTEVNQALRLLPALLRGSPAETFLPSRNIIFLSNSITIGETKQLQTAPVVGHTTEIYLEDAATSGCTLEMRFTLRNVKCILPEQQDPYRRPTGNERSAHELEAEVSHPLSARGCALAVIHLHIHEKTKNMQNKAIWLQKANLRGSVSISQWQRASTIFCTCIWKQKLLWKEPSCSFSLLTTRPGRCRSALNVWNFHWAGSGFSSINAGTCPGWLTWREAIRGYQLLLSHLGRQPSSEVLRGALLSLRLLSHLASQELNSSSILLTLCIGKYILLNAWFCRPRMY